MIVYPSDCERVWPLLPEVAQRALNASQNVVSPSSEIEVAVTITQFDGTRPSNLPFQSCIDAAAMNNPACKYYIDVVGEFARTCAGGPDAPYLKFLNRFSEKYAKNKVLGEVFLTAVTQLQSGDILEPLTMTRIACVATNLIATKVVDKAAKLLTKTDISKLVAKSSKAQTFENEQRISKAFSIALDMYQDRQADEAQCDDLVGKLFVRCMLKLCNKKRRRTR